MNTFNIRLDLDKQASAEVVRMRQGDENGTTIEAAVYDHGRLLGSEVTACSFAMRLPDRTHYYTDSATWDEGTATVTIDESRAASAVGKTMIAYFTLTVGTDTYSTSSFTVLVEPSAVNDASAAETYDGFVEQAIERANEAAEAAEQAAQGVIPDGGVTTSKIADNAVTSGKIADGAVGTADIANSAVTADKLASNAITAVKLASGAVTEVKLADAVRKGYVRAYETVADMQADTNLLVGMTCHTNGFHTSGDGGAAYYTVGASGTANGMDVLALQGGLVATLVVDDTLNVRSLGANSVEANASVFFARAVDLAGEDVTIEVPEGIYNIATPINITTATKINHTGYAVYKPVSTCFIVNGSTRDETKIRNGNCLQPILGGHSWAIVGESDNKENKIGIYLTTASNDADTDSKRNFVIENGNFNYLEKGIVDCAVNSYLYTVSNCQFESNTICYQYGVSGIAKLNSGENITFNKCVFAGSDTSVRFEKDAIIGIFNDCSFDFNNTVFSDNSTGYHSLKIIGGHIEGTGSIGTYPSVFNGSFTYSNIAFIGTNFLIGFDHRFSIGTKVFKSGKTRNLDDYDSPQFRFIGCSFAGVSGSYNIDYRTWIGEYLWSKMYGCEMKFPFCYVPSLNIENAPYFDDDEVGVVAFQNNEAITDSYKISSTNANIEIVSNVEINHKIMVVSGTATFRTKEIVDVANHAIAVNRLSETPAGVSSVSLDITFEDGSTQSITPYQNHPTGYNTGVFNMTGNSWGVVKLGSNVKSIKGRCVITDADNLKFGGIILSICD